MNQAPTDWASAIAILVGGVILGLLFLVFFGRRKSTPIEADPEKRDLEAKRDALIQQLRDLDEKATPEERGRLERETADVLRRLDARAASAAARPATQQPSNPATSPSSINPALKGFLWGAGSFAVIAGMLFLVWQKSNPRDEGQPATGSTPMAQQQPAPDPMIQQLEQAVAKDPENNALRTDLARAYLDKDNLMGVFEQTKFVLDRNPNDPRALTLNALVRVAMGEGEVALQMLEKSTKLEPKDLDSWVALAWVYAQGGRMPDAEKAIAEAIRVSPENKQRLESVLAQMKGHAQQPAGAPQTAAVTGTEELPAGHPPVGDQPPAAPAAPVAAGGRSITVTLDLDPGATARTGILFVMARPPAGGPPVAVKRLMATNFPMTFQFGAADSMMGQPLPDQFRLEARLDSDGDAATKPPTDPSARADNVAPGATVKLALK